MSVTLQVLYPVADGTRFDHDYYTGTHLPLVAEHFGPHLHSTLVTRVTASAPGAPPEYHAIATLVFHDQGAFDAAMAVAEPVLSDIPKFTDTTPQMQVGSLVT